MLITTSPPRSTVSAESSCTESFPTAPAGYANLLAWLGSFGTIAVIGVEGTGSYGAGLARTWPTLAWPWSTSTAPSGAGRASPTLSTP